MRVLIVKPSSLGGIVRALPALDFLHKVTTEVEIDWVVEEEFSDLLAGNPLISRLHLLRSKEWRKRPLALRTLGEIAALRAALKGRAYDFVFDIHGDLKSGVASWLTGAGNRLGFTDDAVLDRSNLFFSTRQVPLRRQDSHITDQCLRLVTVPFAKDYSSLELKGIIPIDPDDDVAASALLATLGDGLVFFFHCGSSWQTKLWSDGRWVALGKALLGRHPEATLLLSWGTPAEREGARTIAESIGNGARVVDHHSAKALAALLKKVDLVVGGDAGPVHLAAALGTPTVSFYRATNGKNSGPRGAHNIIIQAPIHCTACYRTTCDGDRKCRESITTEMVLRGIEKALGS